MAVRERLIKNGLFFCVLVYYLAGYLWINEWTSHREHFYHLDFPFEKDLPLLPSLIFAYLLEFFFLALAYLVVDDLAFFKKIAQAMVVCVTLHFVIYLVFPVQYHLRPAIDASQGWAYLLVDFYYWIDLPYNCFPSLHVSNVFLIAFFLQKYRPFWGWVLHPLALLVAISVVFVKQHYIADVASGFFIGWFVYRQVFES